MESNPKSAPTLVAPDESGPRSERTEVDQEPLRPPSSSRHGRARELDPEALIGTVVDGRYQVESMLGEGGMGIVYLARHRLIDKRVAIKVLRREMAHDLEMTERFLQEARTASSIGNAHIVDVSDFGVLPEGLTYFVMEHLDGQSLTHLLEDLKTLTVARALHITKQIARGLGAAHAAGIVHRDLKPDNVMLVTRGQERDFVKILDFGIAKVGKQATKITRAGSIFGTPHYMSPEQAGGNPVDARTDVYALGVIMYELLAGRVPFDADAVMGVLSQHLYKQPTPLHVATSRDDIPNAVEAVVMKCLRKDPEARYASMDALVDDLEALERGILPLAALESGIASSPAFEPPTGTSGVALAAVSSQANLSSGARFAVLGTAAVVAFGVLVAVVTSLRSPRAAVNPALATEPTVPPANTSLSSPPAAAPAPVEKIVLFNADPLDARVTRDGVDLGAAPLVLRLKQGERVTLTVAKPGFATKTEVVDAANLEGAETKLMVRLAPNGITKPAAKAPAMGGQRPSRPRISEHDDPWKKTP